MPKRKTPSLPELQAIANEYARKTLLLTPFHLVGLDDEDFEKAMNAITQAIVSAWAAGYAKGRE